MMPRWPDGVALVSTHDMVLVKRLFPRTLVMYEGQIVADGLTMEILEDEKLLEAHGLEKPSDTVNV